MIFIVSFYHIELQNFILNRDKTQMEGEEPTFGKALT